MDNKNTVKRILDNIYQILKDVNQLSTLKTSYEDFKTFNDLCMACDITEEEFNNKWLNHGFDPSTIAFEKMKILTKAYNQDWKFDLHNTNQKKYYPWFKIESSGFGFGNSRYGYGISTTTVGSRLCFESEEKSNHAGKNFSNIFYEFITAEI